MTQTVGEDAFAMKSCEPVLFRSDSSQRKNDVLIHQSKRFPNKCSEWYFVRRNKNTNNETYRCVHCRSVHEKARRRKNATGTSGVEVVAAAATADSDMASRPGARIIVHAEFFVTNPDFPLGAHICDFENNPTSDAHVVWSRRALIRANSELRLNPEKPKVKFQQMLESIERGNGEYAYLSTKLRQNIVEHLTSKKGFDSRRRSFARNNSLALKRMREKQIRDELSASDPRLLTSAFLYGGGGSEPVYQVRRLTAPPHFRSFADGHMEQSPAIFRLGARHVSVKCGMPGCNATFRSESERAHHRQVIHPNVYFVDSYEEFAEYRDLVLESNGKYMDEVITTEFGRIVDVGVFERPGDAPALDFFVVDAADYAGDEVVVEPKLSPTAVAPNKQPTSRNDSSSAEVETVNHDRVLERQNRSFLGQIDSMLTQIYNCAAAVANYPIRRDVVENTIHNMMNECIRDAAKVKAATAGRISTNGAGITTFRRRRPSSFYNVEENGEENSGYDMTAEEAYFYAPLPKRKRPNILSVQKVQ